MIYKKKSEPSPLGFTIKLIFLSVIFLSAEQIINFFIGEINWLPSFLILVVIYAGFIKGDTWGIFAGFVMGYINSLLTLSDPGLNTLCWMLIGWFAGRMKKYFYFDKFSSLIFPMILLIFAEYVIFMLLKKMMI